MTNNRIALLGSAVAGMLLLCGAASAQPYDRYDDSAGDRAPVYDRAYDNPVAPADETVIVHPYYDQVEKRQLLGRVDGAINPVEVSISRPVSFADLDLSRDDDYMELHARVRDTARDLCAQLDDRYPQLRGDRSADRQCVRTATRNAMRSVLYPDG